VGDDLTGVPRVRLDAYFVETVEGEEERAWELCPECRGGDAFPSREGGQASASSSPRSS